MDAKLENLLPHTKWIKVNWDALVKANIPAMDIADGLVSSAVYDPGDEDYQCIQKERTAAGKVRLLLETIRPKSTVAFNSFKEVLYRTCPNVKAACIEPEDALTELSGAACKNYKALKVKPFTWLKRVKPVKASTFYLDLSLVEKSHAEEMMCRLASSSAKELERQEYLYSQPPKQKLIRLDSLFPQFQKPQLFDQNSGIAAYESSEAAQSVDSTRADVATGVSNASAIVISSEEDPQSCSLQSAQRVSIYGNAGVGKTSCMMKAASMYAEKRLWPGARAFLLWKLRDRNVQDANSLAQLLQHLNFGLTKEKCEDLASVLLSSNGENVILALDGVDELDSKAKGYVRRLLDGSALERACVLATSRACNTARTYFDKYNIYLELLGFKEEQVDQFIEEQLGDEPNLVSNLQRVLLENPTLASLMLVPLLAMMVCQVFRATAKSPPTTRTKLYLRLLALVLQRTVEESEGRVYIPDDQRVDTFMVLEVHKLPANAGARKLLLELAQLAFLAHEDGKAIFTHNYVRNVAKCSSESLKVGLLASYDVEEETAVMPQYSFQHLTVQEFLVAYRLIADITSEEELKDKVSVLIRSTHNHVVLQFFAGLLSEHLRPHFFAILNQWLHEEYDMSKEKSRSRLRVCLQCAKEACGGDVKDFPSTLELPQRVTVEHVTAADLMQLSLALEKSQHIERLYLFFDELTIESEDCKKVSRVKTQTRRALTRLMDALNANRSLLYLILVGPRYSLFEENGWRLFVDCIVNSSLVRVSVCKCELENTSFNWLSNALIHNTQLTHLWMTGNGLNDVSVRQLADDLKDNNTLQYLNLSGNSYGEESRERLQHQLNHISSLCV